MQGKVRMLELTIYGLVGLAAMLIVAFCFAYADDFSPAREQSPFDLIDDAHLNDAQIIETGSAQLRGTVGMQRETSPSSLPQLTSRPETSHGVIWIDGFQSDRGQLEVLNG
jgi:hypothetical protein